jgi:hypothetical protein
MENLSNLKKINILPEFQNFLLEKKLAPEKNVFFMCYAEIWGTPCQLFSETSMLPSDLCPPIELVDDPSGLSAQVSSTR